MATGMIVGGLIGPALSGHLADLFDLRVAIGIAGAAAIAAAVTCWTLEETAPRLAGYAHPLTTHSHIRP
jgi:MFS family permease